MRDFLKTLSSKVTGRREAARLRQLPAQDRALISRIRSENLTYLSVQRLASLLQTAQAVEQQQLSGAFLEAGCALGGSSILLASSKHPSRPMFIYDVFDMIPAPTSEDTSEVHNRYETIVEGTSDGIGGDTYYGYQANLYEVVRGNLIRFSIDLDEGNVSLVKGLVQDTMNIGYSVALAHVDVDWYEPVMTCLERIFPQLVIGGSIILDDYNCWGGCKKATDEFLQGVAGQFAMSDAAGALKVTKTSNPGE